MSHRRFIISRRTALAGLAASASLAWPGLLRAAADAENDSGPIFSSTGPNAELYGAAEGYPFAVPGLVNQPGEPRDPKYLVGAFSHGDENFPTRRIARAASPWMFRRTALDIRYQFDGKPSSPTEYMSRHPVTGLLIIKDDTILFERYQYARTDRDRLFSGSMVKTITAMLVGIAIADGAIKSVDDTPQMYVPGFEGTEYGRTPIRDLLHMSSGVEFGEAEDNQRDLDRLWVDMIQKARSFQKGTVKSITQFNHRIAPPGTRFYYASIEPDVLGLVVHYALQKSLSEYLQENVWQPIGAEADATWLIDAEGFEVAHTHFHATLRDYGRLGRLFAYDGSWEGKQIIPRQWMIDATTIRASDAYLAPGQLAHHGPFGYGYLIWLLPGGKRQFVFRGSYGQHIFVDPASKLVMVQTAVETRQNEVEHLWASLVKQFGQG